MSNDLRESLSALMDGEASELELRRVLRDAKDDDSAFWGRMHRQRSAMQGDATFSGLDISARVSAAIADEAPLVASARDWRKPLAGFAVAASVAAMVVFGLGGGSSQPAAPQMAEAPAAQSGRVYLASPATNATGAVTASAANVTVPLYRQVDDEQSRERFERFLRQHTERAALNSGQGMVTYARMVSHGEE
ncbi:sigma-E factor negative regulatory protein RseA [Litorivivens lipolytica]|uniref:Sigma-E factor negative regulatory protein RseA n=1 Tax=Litorivivens lipolytica TaxID=1524264 RepID=A0A7W4W251_9GAMM|nr:sigma-E factor negative regulatory protein [Litorivivens lipolytica]MBB3045996.1 sigma-E factor negative regulatory protein RseA [Litorivivens lipolytica]